MDSIGRVESVRKDISVVTGMHNVGLSNVVSFSSGGLGIVLGFEGTKAQVIMLSGQDGLKKGDLVRAVEPSPGISVSEKLLGRVIDPLGNAVDGRGELDATSAVRLPIDAIARPIYQRALVDRSLKTGYTVIDSQIPIGLGQRELLLGERKSGQNDIAVDIICNQTYMKTGVICVYVAIDAESAPTKRRVERLGASGALDNSVVIFSHTAAPASLSYIAPMVGVTIAEWFAAQGKNVLIVYDDLTRHAKVYRQLSLLMNRPASREAYPGDIFYLHSRLLERAGAFNEQAGNGTITALPIVETPTEEATDYITTNLMSITDGHILFRRALANKGLRPPIDSGFSVSRIGGRIQPKLLRELSEQLKEVLVRYAEIERFMAFGTDLNNESLEIYELGRRAYSIFDQVEDEFYGPIAQVVLLYFLVSKEALQWRSEQMLDLKMQLMAFTQKAPYKDLLNEALLVSTLEQAKATLDECMRDFKKDSKTLIPIQSAPKLVAETETISGILHSNEDVYHDEA